MKEEFDSIGDFGYGLAGWFDGFCPSNGIADRLKNQAKGVWGQKQEWDVKMRGLENGKQAAQWESLKAEVRRLETTLKAEQQKLTQEKGIADALGLGAWCNDAVSKRKKAQESLRDAEASLGAVKGAFQTLERQQSQGIATASKVIATHKKQIEVLQQEVAAIKQKIAAYKAQRDHEQQAAAQGASNQEMQQAQKDSFMGQLKENAPLLLGGIALASVLFYVNGKGASSKKKKVTV